MEPEKERLKSSLTRGMKVIFFILLVFFLVVAVILYFGGDII